MGFFSQEYWSRLPFPPPEDLPDLGIEPASPVSPALAGGFFTHWAIREPHTSKEIVQIIIFLDILSFYFCIYFWEKNIFLFKLIKYLLKYLDIYDYTTNLAILLNIYDCTTNLPLLRKKLIDILQLIKSWIKTRGTFIMRWGLMQSPRHVKYMKDI